MTAGMMSSMNQMRAGLALPVSSRQQSMKSSNSPDTIRHTSTHTQL